jgi:hypothetical protein
MLLIERIFLLGRIICHIVEELLLENLIFQLTEMLKFQLKYFEITNSYLSESEF